jgi:putative transposase
MALSGYGEIQERRDRYAIIDVRRLSGLCGFAEVPDFWRARRQLVSEALTRELPGRDHLWSQAIAVGSSAFINKIKSELGLKAMHREVAF